MPDKAYDPRRLFSTDSAKAAKAEGFGYLNAIHYMAPYTSGGAGNLCSHASAECIALCLGWYSGQASMVRDLEEDTNSVRDSRIAKAQAFMHDRNAYMNDLARSVVANERKARREELELCVRLNGSTDVAYERMSFALDAKTARLCGRREGERITMLALFPHLQFVDYTKNPNRLGKAPANLALTLSFAGDNEPACVAALERGHNVAVIFAGAFPATWNGFPVIDGDAHDLRHLDPRNVVVGLSPKGAKAKAHTGPMVVRETLALAA
jgi:hypothetical protein